MVYLKQTPMLMVHNKNVMHSLFWSLVISFYKGQGSVTIYQGLATGYTTTCIYKHSQSVPNPEWVVNKYFLSINVARLLSHKTRGEHHLFFGNLIKVKMFEDQYF